MQTRKIFGILCVAGFLFSACSLIRRQATPVIVPVVIQNSEKIPVEVTRIVRKTQLVPVEVTRIVLETQIVPVEVTRIVRETIVVTPAPPPESPVNVTQGNTLLVPRSQHTATRLADGRILLVGGSTSPEGFLADVEMFNPLTGIITRVTPLHTPRHDHTATLLPDGRVLVSGGYSLPKQWLIDAEVYDPSMDTWTVVPSLYTHGVQHTATLMKDGRVLVVGGAVRSGPGTDRVEIFDPRTNSWSEAMPLASDRASHTAQLLEDGRVLVAGGGGGSGVPAGGDALLFDPQTNTWTATGPMVTPRIFGQSMRLSDGRVLVVGGTSQDGVTSNGPNRKMFTKAEIFNPATNEWTAAKDLSQARYAHSLVLLQDGRVLVSGGARDWDCCWSDNSFVREIEVYDPAVDRWTSAGDLPLPAAFSAAVLLPDGSVWVTGGKAGQSGTTFWSDTWLLTPMSTQP